MLAVHLEFLAKQALALNEVALLACASSLPAFWTLLTLSGKMGRVRTGSAGPGQLSLGVTLPSPSPTYCQPGGQLRGASFLQDPFIFRVFLTVPSCYPCAQMALKSAMTVFLVLGVLVSLACSVLSG